MSEKEINAELSRLTNAKEEWAEKVSWVGQYLEHPSLRIRAKAVWLYGEMGLRYSEKVKDRIPVVSALLGNSEALLRERALNALGRIGRADFELVQAYLPDMLLLATDPEPKVRIAFIWACENIATSSPDVFASGISLFAALLEDKNERVRMEAPEIFRVLAKQRADLVREVRPLLAEMSTTDENRVVRIHCAGAVKVIDKDGE